MQNLFPDDLPGIIINGFNKERQYFRICDSTAYQITLLSLPNKEMRGVVKDLFTQKRAFIANNEGEKGNSVLALANSPDDKEWFWQVMVNCPTSKLMSEEILCCVYTAYYMMTMENIIRFAHLVEDIGYWPSH